MKTKIIVTAILASIVMTAAAAQNAHERPDFSSLDANGDGGVTLAEMNAHRAARFATTDSNGDGALSVDELTTVAHRQAAERVARMLERFDALDDGLLQQAEMPQRGGDRAERMFGRIDADSNGTITQMEFDAIKDRMGDRKRHGDRG